jgi:membrane-bound ClpP family serine protease
MSIRISVLIIGIILGFVGMVIPKDGTFGVIGFYVMILGVIMVVGAIAAFVMRFWGRMLSD